MKDVLIIFMILLVLLMLISTFGGSIRPTERFYQEIPTMQENPYMMTQQESTFVPPASMAPPSMPPASMAPPVMQESFKMPAPPTKFESFNTIEPFDNSDVYASLQN